MPENSFDLARCVGCTNELQLRKYSKTLDLEYIEEIFAGIREGREHLTLRKLNRLKRSDCWIFRDYWYLPSSGALAKGIKKTKGLFTDLPENEIDIIRILYRIFKNIEVVSIILRFIDPVNYGVISPPVRYSLQQMLTPGWDYVNEYIEYLALLRDLRPVYGFSRVADLENALWTLVEKCLRQKNASCSNLLRFRENFLTVQEHILLEQYREAEYQDRIMQLENEISAHKKAESELEETYISDLSRLESEKEETEENLKTSRNEIARLGNVNKHLRADLLFNIVDSPRRPEEKLVHETGHDVSRNQRRFMQRLINYSKVHHVIWSENATVKPPTRVSEVRSDGEVVIYYVGDSNYAAKIKIYPVEHPPDLTHARYFSLLISRHMEIRNEYIS